jgi:hypothetical protein
MLAGYAGGVDLVAVQFPVSAAPSLIEPSNSREI